MNVENVVPSVAPATDASSLDTASAVHEVLPPPAAVAPTGKARVAISPFTKASDAALIVACLAILNGMSGNAAYPVPFPKLAEIAAARNSFIASVDAARDSRRARPLRMAQRAALVALLRNLAHYVQVTCGGNLGILLSSGFTAQRSPQPIGPLSAPGDLRLVRGKVSGQIIARVRKLRQAGSYEWRYASADTPTAWIPLATLAASVTIDGLVPGTRYLVQARVRGTAGASNWTDAAVLMVV